MTGSDYALGERIDVGIRRGSDFPLSQGVRIAL